MNCSVPDFPVLHYLPQFAHTHVLESVMLSYHLILCCPLLPLPSVFPSIWVFSNELALRISWPKYMSFNISPSKVWFPCCVSDSQESTPALQFKNINPSVLSLPYGPTPTSVLDYWEIHSFWPCGCLLAKWRLCFLICYLCLSCLKRNI